MLMQRAKRKREREREGEGERKKGDTGRWAIEEEGG
jgi:hypothetical protein